MRKERRVLRPTDVADRFGVTDITVNKWADDGLIPSFRTPGGQRRFYEDEIEEYIAGQRPRAAS